MPWSVRRLGSLAATKIAAWQSRLFATIPAFLRDGKWWIDHSVDIMTLIATIVLGFFIHALDSNEREHDSAAQNAATKQLSDSQDLARRQSSAENDRHQAYTLLTELQLHRGPGKEVERRAIADVIEQYALDGRLYEPATHIFLPVLQTECDQETFRLLRTAVEDVANVSRQDAITKGEQDDDASMRKETQLHLLTAVTDRESRCKEVQPTDNGSNGLPAPTKTLDIPLGNFNVGCDEPRNESRSISIASIVPSGYQVVESGAEYRDTSNVQKATATAVIQGDNIIVQSSLIGIPSQAFPLGIRNCAGGGHGTLILRLVLKTTATANPR